MLPVTVFVDMSRRGTIALYWDVDSSLWKHVVEGFSSHGCYILCHIMVFHKRKLHCSPWGSNDFLARVGPFGFLELFYLGHVYALILFSV